MEYITDRKSALEAQVAEQGRELEELKRSNVALAVDIQAKADAVGPWRQLTNASLLKQRALKLQ